MFTEKGGKYGKHSRPQLLQAINALLVKILTFNSKMSVKNSTAAKRIKPIRNHTELVTGKHFLPLCYTFLL